LEAATAAAAGAEEEEEEEEEEEAPSLKGRRRGVPTGGHLARRGLPRVL